MGNEDEKRSTVIIETNNAYSGHKVRLHREGTLDFYVERADREGNWTGVRTRTGGGYALDSILEALLARRAPAEPSTSDREALASWMLSRSYSTGHGDSVDGLLEELGRQVDEGRDPAARQQAEEVAGLSGCRFCPYGVVQYDQDEHGGWYYFCRTCKASGPTCDEKPKALELWNLMMAPAPAWRPQGDEAERLRAAIRKHRDQRGDDRCWLDDRELYAALPEGVAGADLRLPPSDEMLANCKRYIASRHEPGTPYVSPQRRIEELEALRSELRELKSNATIMADGFEANGQPVTAGAIRRLFRLAAPEAP